MAENQPEREPKQTQQTQPKKGKPIEIPVPKRGFWEQVLGRATKAVPQDGPGKEQGDPLA